MRRARNDQLRMANDFRVEIEMHGRAAEIVYRERGGRAVFGGEFGGTPEVIFIVYVPRPERWDAQFPWAVGRRQAILDRVGAECVRQKCRHCSYVIHDESVEIIDPSG